jgi:tungstate transport system substrate-binding protein
MRAVSRTLSLVLALLVAAASAGLARDRVSILIASTTSTEQSGLFRHLLPAFTASSGIGVRVIAVGSGQAIDIGRRGDADVVLVHDRDAESKAVAEGYLVERRDVMYNDFVLVGPRSDPAGIGGGKDVAAALRAIARAGAVFVSRGDRSGTHAAELRHWNASGIDPGEGRGSWYRETGQGMGPVLNTAAASSGYTLSDRGTWLAFRNRQDLVVLVEGDPRLVNQYGVMLVDPSRHPHVRRDAGRAFIDWITSPAGQQAIAEYRIGGERLFFPNYAANAAITPR